jgi:hypothetical protein
MIYMMKHIETTDQSIYNIFPLRTDIIPKHIKIDTTTLVHLLLRKEHGTKHEYLTKGNLKRNEDLIWQFFFRTERQCFRKTGYSFHHMILTDGLSCCLLFLREDMIGRRIRTSTQHHQETYIDDITDYSHMKDKKIVAIDPGKCDLLYCVDNDNKTATQYRYSQDQRRKESKSKHFTKIILELKREKINNKSIIDYETELSKYNRKSLDIDKYKDYIRQKNKTNQILLPFYSKLIFRKLKLHSYINIKRSEQKMLNRFQQLFGTKEDVIVCFGDYEQKKHMKFKEPIKGKGMRTLFRRNGYKTYLVDEFRTSCMCSTCGDKMGRCEKFLKRENPRPFRNTTQLVHGLLRCKTCDGVWNRDCNGATNIYRLVKMAILGKKRPRYLSRKLSSTLDDVLLPKKLHGQKRSNVEFFR